MSGLKAREAVTGTGGMGALFLARAQEEDYFVKQRLQTSASLHSLKPSTK
jgi:hypothetical protein